MNKDEADKLQIKLQGFYDPELHALEQPDGSIHWIKTHKFDDKEWIKSIKRYAKEIKNPLSPHKK